MYGSVNFNTIQTDPGAHSAFAPPAGFDGDYAKYMVEKMKCDPGVRQHVACVARRFSQGKTPSKFEGRYATLAELLAMKVHRKMSGK